MKSQINFLLIVSTFLISINALCEDPTKNIDYDCSCPDIFYNDNVGICQKCMTTCDSCSNGYTCDSCKPNFVLNKGICECPQEFIYFQDECLEGCGDKEYMQLPEKSCQPCKFYNELCVQECPDNTTLNGSVCEMPESIQINFIFIVCGAGILVLASALFYNYKTTRIDYKSFQNENQQLQSKEDICISQIGDKTDMSLVNQYNKKKLSDNTQSTNNLLAYSSERTTLNSNFGQNQKDQLDSPVKDDKNSVVPEMKDTLIMQVQNLEQEQNNNDQNKNDQSFNKEQQKQQIDNENILNQQQENIDKKNGNLDENTDIEEQVVSKPKKIKKKRLTKAVISEDDIQQNKDQEKLKEEEQKIDGNDKIEEQEQEVVKKVKKKRKTKIIKDENEIQDINSQENQEKIIQDNQNQNGADLLNVSIEKTKENGIENKQIQQENQENIEIDMNQQNNVNNNEQNIENNNNLLNNSNTDKIDDIQNNQNLEENKKFDQIENETKIDNLINNQEIAENIKQNDDNMVKEENLDENLENQQNIENQEEVNSQNNIQENKEKEEEGYEDQPVVKKLKKKKKTKVGGKKKK